MSDLAPVLKQRFFDASGLPLVGGLLYSYAAGTTTPLATYTDESGLTPNTNPVVLDSEGYANIWLSANSYKFALYDANNNLQFTVDNVESISFLLDSLGIQKGFTSTATAAGTTILTIDSTLKQYFTGSTTQTVKLPVVTTLVNGFQFLIVNLSSGVVTVQSSGANSVQAMAANSQLVVTCINTAGGTGTASWSWVYTPVLDASLPIANGGTGQITKSAAFNALSPMTTGGDIIYGGASGTGTRLANGSSGQALTSGGGTAAPTWSTVAIQEFHMSTQVTALSSGVSSGTFTTFDNSPAFTFTPTNTGTFKVYCSLPVDNAGSNTIAVARVIASSGSPTLLAESQGFFFESGAAGMGSTQFIQSVYTLTAGVSYQFDIQGKALSGSIEVRGDVGSFYMFAEKIA